MAKAGKSRSERRGEVGNSSCGKEGGVLEVKTERREGEGRRQRCAFAEV